jgi:cobalt/nickel transport system permease protein
MHLPDHVLDPTTLAATAVFSAGAVAYSIVRVRKEPTPKIIAAAGIAAVVFAAQMVNFPVASGTSGHLVGGALAGLLLGPWAGLLAMSAVLAVQAIVFGDGGILALGANILNMGLIGVAIGVAVDRLLVTPRANSTLVRRVSASALAGWMAVVAAALVCAIELAVSGAASLSEVVPKMLGAHAIIGLAEGGITAVFVTACEYGIAHGWLGAVERQRRVLGATLACLAIVVVALSPLASTLPDGLESVAASIASLQPEAVATMPPVLADYAIPGIAWASTATVLAGIVGIALVFGVTSLAGIGIRRTN